MTIKKGDKIKVTTGADKGKSATVLAVFPKENKVLVEGVNLKSKHVRAKRENEKGQTVKKAYPIAISNVVKA